MYGTISTGNVLESFPVLPLRIAWELHCSINRKDFVGIHTVHAFIGKRGDHSFHYCMASIAGFSTVAVGSRLLEELDLAAAILSGVLAQRKENFSLASSVHCVPVVYDNEVFVTTFALPLEIRERTKRAMG